MQSNPLNVAFIQKAGAGAANVGKLCIEPLKSFFTLLVKDSKSL